MKSLGLAGVVRSDGRTLPYGWSPKYGSGVSAEHQSQSILLGNVNLLRGYLYITGVSEPGTINVVALPVVPLLYVRNDEKAPTPALALSLLGYVLTGHECPTFMTSTWLCPPCAPCKTIRTEVRKCQSIGTILPNVRSGMLASSLCDSSTRWTAAYLPNDPTRP
jgi:hypothetical protein